MLLLYPVTSIYPIIIFAEQFYKEGISQRLQRDEASERLQHKKAIAADSWYLTHNFPMQSDAAEWADEIMRSATLAVEQAAANDRNDRTCSWT